MMNVAVFEKWIEGTTPDDRPGEAAVRSLENRLGAVVQLLPAAAEHADEDVEHIHALRVATRRATAALHLYADLLPRGGRSWIKKQLKRVRRAANQARDCDVLIERLKQGTTGGADEWANELQAERKEAQDAVVAVDDRLRRDDRFARRVDKFLEKTRRRCAKKSRHEPERFGEWARRRLRPPTDRLFAAVPDDRADAAALHQFRIAAKELRYAMELLAGGFPDEFRTIVYPTVETLQERLGRINDLATATARLEKKLDDASGRDASPWRHLLDAEQAKLAAALSEFWNWCTADRLDELRDQFRRNTGDGAGDHAAPAKVEHHGDGHSPQAGCRAASAAACSSIDDSRATPAVAATSAVASTPAAPSVRAARSEPPVAADSQRAASPSDRAPTVGPPSVLAPAAGSPSTLAPPEGSPGKARIVGELGEAGLLLPALVNDGLVANDQAKYLMTLLQTAREHADHSESPVSDLKQERTACGIAEVELDAVVAGTRKEGETYAVPSVRRIHDLLVEDIRRMIAPLHAAGSGLPDSATTGQAMSGRDANSGTAEPSSARPPSVDGRSAESYEDRLGAILSQTASPAADRVSGEYVTRIASADRQAGDGLHLLVMDLHKELNGLQRRVAAETIAGAQVYGLGDEDRPLVAAFMAGINRTRELKFDHPGLGTTATRTGDRLVIQNDIGMTDAHVLVIHVEGRRVTLTYTDVHIERLVFFQDLFDRFQVGWNDTVSKRATGLGDDLYHLCRGTYEARDADDLAAYLTFLGSRLVFLIDWNRARKALRKFARRKVCLEVLRWGADHDLGHRGFLSLGGEQLIFDALETAGRLPLPPGGRLSDALGAERTAEFLKFALQTASEGLRAGRSEFLIRDEISAELRHYVDTIHHWLLEVAAEHASLVVELAQAARDMLAAAGPARDADLVARLVRRAGVWEHRADELVNRCRAANGRGDAPGPVLDLLVAADDAADELESAVFRMSLLPADVSPASPPPLNDLVEPAVEGAQEYLKVVENARCLHRGSSREQVADFLEAVDRTLVAEHRADKAHRRSEATVLSFAGDYKQWYLVGAIADKLEAATDAMLRSALMLRDYILRDVLRR